MSSSVRLSCDRSKSLGYRIEPNGHGGLLGGASAVGRALLQDGVADEEWQPRRRNDTVAAESSLRACCPFRVMGKRDGLSYLFPLMLDDAVVYGQHRWLGAILRHTLFSLEEHEFTGRTGAPVTRRCGHERS